MSAQVPSGPHIYRQVVASRALVKRVRPPRDTPYVMLALSIRQPLRQAQGRLYAELDHCETSAQWDVLLWVARLDLVADIPSGTAPGATMRSSVRPNREMPADKSFLRIC